MDKPAVDNFIAKFVSKFKEHGGQVGNEKPAIIAGVLDIAEALRLAYERAFVKIGGTAYKAQMVVIIMPNKNTESYHRIKKNCELRFGLVSQCVQSQHAKKCADQYLSNVLTKVNCKLGGTVCIVKTKTGLFKGKTMIIGADVSHPSPNSDFPSVASLTVSSDVHAARYWAGIETNGARVEMITSANMDNLLTPFIQQYMTTAGQGRLPDHVYYFRDGVSEGQYRALLTQEVADLKFIFNRIVKEGGGTVPKITVIVAEKRHHIRFFPQPGSQAADKNGNVKPGMVVDRDVVHPFENDIYMCSHVAIQGTARPTHYQVLMDEADVPTDILEALLYNHCYQYQRATTPVSLCKSLRLSLEISN